MTSLIPTDSAQALRCAGPAQLARALARGREQLLALFDGFEQALGPGLRIGYDPLLNLPLWELGHIGWFEEFWLARNGHRGRGAACDPESAPRSPSLLALADVLYDSSKVAHPQRWQLPLPDAAATRAYLAAVRETTLALLHRSGSDDDSLYFFRLVLFHEAMHREAWYFGAQQLGIDLGPAMAARAPRPALAHGEWDVPAALLQLGSAGGGFSFDNELAAHPVAVAAFTIDRAPVTWSRYLPFIESGAYDDARWWSDAGWSWRRRQALAQPRHLRRGNAGWQQQRFGSWVALDPAAPAIHLSAHEAEGWCRWAGRRLPTEAEWELAATTAAAQPGWFEWGQVWEWTASPFAPYPGFVAHPYRDYSRPWFDDGRLVLRGASFATDAAIKDPRYRNFFSADRNDVFAGFRSCAID